MEPRNQEEERSWCHEPRGGGARKPGRRAGAKGQWGGPEGEKTGQAANPAGEKEKGLGLGRIKGQKLRKGPEPCKVRREGDRSNGIEVG